MTLKEQLLKEIEQAPESLVEEVLNFLLATKARQTQKTLEKKTSSSSQTTETSLEASKPIWEVADEIIALLPKKALDELPTDGAAELDYYLYGAPKQDS